MKSKNYDLICSSAAQHQGNQWMTAEDTATGDSSSTGSVTSAALFTLGKMTIGRANTSLPLFFLAVSAKHEAGVNKIEWKTSNEWNVQRFEIQKSTSGFGFNTIASRPARNSPNEQVYTFYDRPVSLGKTFYRIRNIDMDCHTGNSKVVSVFLSGKQTLKILTNPIATEIVVAVTLSSVGPYQYQLLTMEGKTVQSGTISGSSGNLRIQLRSAIFSGTYILMLKNEQLNFRQKVIVK